MSCIDLIKYGGAPLAGTATAATSPKVANADESEYGSVERRYNKIYLYTEVTSESCAMTQRAIEDATAEMQQYSTALSIPEPPRIELHIQSPGGALLPTFGLIDFIARNPVSVDSYIDAFAASAATLISVSCSRRYAYPHSIMMLHQLSGSASGKFTEMETQVKNMDLFMEMIRRIYVDHTAMNRSELNGILAKDDWFSAQNCLDRGIIDAIL
ncbi:ClpP/crotonase-like domain-containing protein [Tribonema minus]|uniref:ATP-dependent Clp protease proteolytic subunit n=1 Tax=Tribonema minus TaxID=303371 RepID=A0A835YR95_9STRA|nr:ClpP/crotonase-like domain-containing protein [Tribonema minus]